MVGPVTSYKWGWGRFFFHPSYPFIKSFTLPETETNIAPENRPSQKEFHLPTIDFQVQFVGFRKGIGFITPFITGRGPTLCEGCWS